MADDSTQIEEGPIKTIDPDRVPKEPPNIIEGFEWVTMDLEVEKQVHDPSIDTLRLADEN